MLLCLCSLHANRRDSDTEHCLKEPHLAVPPQTSLKPQHPLTYGRLHHALQRPRAYSSSTGFHCLSPFHEKVPVNQGEPLLLGPLQKSLPEKCSELEDITQLSYAAGDVCHLFLNFALLYEVFPLCQWDCLENPFKMLQCHV